MSSVSRSTAMRSRRSSSSRGRVALRSWIQPWTPISWRPDAWIMSIWCGARVKLSAGPKNEAAIPYSSSRSMMRPRATREPYSPCDRPPTFVSPFRSQTVSLSTSKESSTATRPPSGHESGFRSRPARTRLTASNTRASDQRHGGSSAS